MSDGEGDLVRGAMRGGESVEYAEIWGEAVSPMRGERGLYAAILNRAVRDLRSRDRLLSQDAEAWFRGWAEYASRDITITRTGWTCKEVCHALDLEVEIVLEECFRDWEGVAEERDPASRAALLNRAVKG